MAEYINIRGQNVETVASDPANPTIGQIWYNSTSNTLKGLNLTTSATWATGGNLPAAKVYFGSTGETNNALAVAGENTVTQVNTVEEYNGTTWTAGTSFPRSAYAESAAGPGTAAIVSGGSEPSPTNSSVAAWTYDGSTWSPTGSMSTKRGFAAAGGIQTASFMAGGTDFIGSTTQTATENFNGTSWTTSGSLSVGRRTAAGAGTQTAGLAYGGLTPAKSNSTEEYNGSSWTTGGNLNTARGYTAGFGIQTAAILVTGITGATPGLTQAVEEYDGTSWTNTTNLPISLYGHGTAGIGGNGTAGIVYGGAAPASGGQQVITHDYIAAGSPVTETITSS